MNLATRGSLEAVVRFGYRLVLETRKKQHLRLPKQARVALKTLRIGFPGTIEAFEEIRDGLQDIIRIRTEEDRQLHTIIWGHHTNEGTREWYLKEWNKSGQILNFYHALASLWLLTSFDDWVGNHLEYRIVMLITYLLRAGRRNRQEFYDEDRLVREALAQLGDFMMLQVAL